MARAPLASDAVLKQLRAYGLAYPGAHTKSPWPDHLDLAVNDKTFAYLSLEGQPFGISCKLPHSSTAALSLPFCKPAGYGLGKSGWVAASFERDDVPPLALFKEWLDESYRAQAPKKLVASLATRDTSGNESSAKPESAKPKSAKPKSAKPESTKPESTKRSSTKTTPASYANRHPKKRARKSIAAKRAAR